MSIPITYSLSRYLAAKKSVDDRALNWQVLAAPGSGSATSDPQQPLRILEVGAGIGSMVERQHYTLQTHPLGIESGS